MGKFAHFIRQQIKLKDDEALFFFINNLLPNLNHLLSQIYKENKDEDGFLYIEYGEESIYG